MSYIPEDIVIACELLIDHYGSDYIDSWEVLQELILDEFEISIPIDTLQAIRVDTLSYLDISINLKICNVIY